MTPSDYEMIEQGYDPPRKPDSLEEENRRLREALKLSRPFVAASVRQAEASTRWYDKAVAALTAIDAALAAEPASGAMVKGPNSPQKVPQYLKLRGDI